MPHASAGTPGARATNWRLPSGEGDAFPQPLPLRRWTVGVRACPYVWCRLTCESAPSALAWGDLSSALSAPASVEPSGKPRSMDTLPASLPNAGASRTTGTSPRQSGSVSNPSTCSAAASRVNRGRAQASGSALLTLGISGPLPSQPFAFFDPDSLSWKKSQGSLLEEASMSSSVTWPPSGMWADGCAYELPMSALLTGENDFSSLLTTPRATRGGSSTENAATLLGTPSAHERTHSPRQVDHGVQLANQVAQLPTPTSRDYKGRNQRNDDSCLPGAVALLPTPTANLYECDQEVWEARREREKAKHQNGNGFGLTLAMAAQTLLPTPRTSDSNGTGEHGTGGPDLRTVIGDHMQQPSTDGRGCSDDEHPTLWTSEDD